MSRVSERHFRHRSKPTTLWGLAVHSIVLNFVVQELRVVHEKLKGMDEIAEFKRKATQELEEREKKLRQNEEATEKIKLDMEELQRSLDPKKEQKLEELKCQLEQQQEENKELSETHEDTTNRLMVEQRKMTDAAEMLQKCWKIEGEQTHLWGPKCEVIPTRYVGEIPQKLQAHIIDTMGKMATEDTNEFVRVRY